MMGDGEANAISEGELSDVEWIDDDVIEPIYSRTCPISKREFTDDEFGKAVSDRVSKYEGDDMDKQKEMIKYFLETMPNLEQVMIYYDTSIDDDPSILSTELQMLEKVASSKCKIQVIPDNISFS